MPLYHTCLETPVTAPVYLFDLASRQAQWLAARQTTISGNVANANTPGYRARDVEPFADVLDKTKLAMAATNTGHIGFTPSKAEAKGAKPCARHTFLFCHFHMPFVYTAGQFVNTLLDQLHHFLLQRHHLLELYIHCS